LQHNYTDHISSTTSCLNSSIGTPEPGICVYLSDKTICPSSASSAPTSVPTDGNRTHCDTFDGGNVMSLFSSNYSI
jgi:hypothetical protein